MAIDNSHNSLICFMVHISSTAIDPEDNLANYFIILMQWFGKCFAVPTTIVMLAFVMLALRSIKIGEVK